MKLHRPEADVFVPDATPMPDAISRTTHLGIGAHQDDLEFFAFHGIAACFRQTGRWFTGVTCTDGSGSARTGPFAGLPDTEMRKLRSKEQRKAAEIGEYAAMIQLDYPSAMIKDPSDRHPVDDLESILTLARPEVLYLHNPTDRHDTHVAVLLRSLAAVHRLPLDQRPRKVWGCEVWRGLDWLVDDDKAALPNSDFPELQSELNGVFKSQILGGKRYDLAVMGRRAANATFSDSHLIDAETGVAFAMDLTPLAHDENIDIADFTRSCVERLKDDVSRRIGRFRG